MTCEEYWHVKCLSTGSLPLINGNLYNFCSAFAWLWSPLWVNRYVLYQSWRLIDIYMILIAKSAHVFFYKHLWKSSKDKSCSFVTVLQLKLINLTFNKKDLNHWNEAISNFEIQSIGANYQSLNLFSKFSNTEIQIS